MPQSIKIQMHLGSFTWNNSNFYYRYHRLIITENLSDGISYQLNSGIITILDCVPKASRGLTFQITAFQLLGQLINQKVITLQSLDLTFRSYSWTSF